MEHKSTPSSYLVKYDVVQAARLLLSDGSIDFPPMPSLMDNQQIRLENFRDLKQKYGPKEIQERLGWSKQQLSQYVGYNKNNRPITDAVARRVERAFNLPNAYMDYPHYESEEVLQKFIDSIRSLPKDQQDSVLQFAQVMINLLRRPPGKPE